MFFFYSNNIAFIYTGCVELLTILKVKPYRFVRVCQKLQKAMQISGLG